MTKRIWQYGMLWTVVLAACAPAAAPTAAPAPAATALVEAKRTITAEDMRTRIGFLASDSLRGRNTPSPGLEAAAEYLAAQLRGMGLQPAGGEGSYIQRFPYRQISLDGAAARLTLQGPQGAPALAYGRDFFTIPAAVDSVSGTAVFIGPATRFMRPDPLTGISGRIVVATVGVQPGSEIFMAAQRIASAGAVGLLFVLHPLHTPQVVEQIATQVAGLGFEMPIPTFGVRYEHAQALFRAAGVNETVLADTAGPAQPQALPRTTLRMSAPVGRIEHPVPNVVAVLPGSDPQLSSEYVILTAHFDHVGVGQPDAQGDSIYNGADDNASGTAVVLEVAEAFSRLPQRPARSVIFLLVSGEEKGLLGARYYADNPTVPIERVVANINLDMVGRNAPDTLVAIGQEYTSLGPLTLRIAQANPQLRLNVITDPNPEEQAFFRSDHVAFLRKDIPAIFFTTWLHEDYHRPSDEVERIDIEKAARVGQLVFLLAHEVASAPERPAWLGDGLQQVREILRMSPF
ncbi:MAG TPA: M20/M25/M40 family metallo-hydrolase [Longimicrobiaceae bacterium]|nr:M20/M25/M40 family metallo-hydrolase [Longimicrobiaceae bacterium]